MVFFSVIVYYPKPNGWQHPNKLKMHTQYTAICPWRVSHV